MGNPFLETSPELLNLDLQNVMDDSVSETVHSVEALGKDQYQKYRKTVILDCTHSIHNPIKRNALSLFRRPASKPKTKQAKQISVLEDNVSLFSRLYIVAKHREGDMANFFKHENQLCPPSLSAYGKLHFSKKSDLLNIISQKSEQDPPSYFDSMAIDGAALVHLLPVNNVSTFDEYASMVFVPHKSKNLLE